MSGDFVFRSGKYVGKTVDWVRDNDAWYIVWVEENRPEMLKELKEKPKISSKNNKEIILTNTSYNSIQPNMNFWNEGPHEMCKPFLEKMKELNKEDEWNF